MTNTTTPNHIYDVAVIGGGAAGVGAAIALRHAGIENLLVLERYRVGASFALWPAETRFITPSFPTNSIGMLDLNSVAIGVSPAFSLEVEHPTGVEYAAHLRAVAQFFELPLREETDVTHIDKADSMFRLTTRDETLLAKHVIWAAGEFQYPRLSGFVGAELCTHTSVIERYDELKGDDLIIIGGYESGIDAAYHLARSKKRVRLFDQGCPWKDESSDPSIALSIYSLERMREACFGDQVELHADTSIVSVVRAQDQYEVTAASGQKFQTPVPPLLAGGFDGGHKLVANLFKPREDGFPELNANDESTIAPGLFFCGPAVRQENQVFCFIYKYRQRFAVVAKAIATSLGLEAEYLETYRTWGMYLDDLSCCGEECVC
ncbi:MAG: NAD(P)/FAD-dependent oxidoreductase [Myxococcota bacterium]